MFANFGIAVGAYSCALDLFFTIYPVFIVSKLNMHIRKKVTVMVTFGLGIFALSITLYKTAAELPKLRYERVDTSRVVAQIILWTISESSVVIIAGSIATWGWILRTKKYEKLITWISAHSPRRTRLSERLDSRGQETDNDSDRHSLRGEIGHGDNGKDSSVGLQSIDRIERSAFS